MIDNPAYIGEWAPRKIPNPDYFEDLAPVKSLKPIGGVGIELWTMTEDILFDNLYIGHSVEDAATLAAESWEVKHAQEEAAKKVMVIDSESEVYVCVIPRGIDEIQGDLEGSTGLKVIHQKHPEVFIPSGSA